MNVCVFSMFSFTHEISNGNLSEWFSQPTSAMKKKPGCLGCVVVILPFVIWFMISHYRNPYEKTSPGFNGPFFIIFRSTLERCFTRIRLRGEKSWGLYADQWTSINTAKRGEIEGDFLLLWQKNPPEICIGEVWSKFINHN